MTALVRRVRYTLFACPAHDRCTSAAVIGDAAFYQITSDTYLLEKKLTPFIL